MFSKLYNFWQITRESLWFVPAVICFFSFCLILGLFLIERTQLSGVYLPEIFYNGTAAEARDVVGLLLSAMITMTTLAVSVTMVVLSLAASQLGPRLIRSFMSDRETQIYIGLFFGTVVACFVAVGILHDDNLARPVPRLMVSAIFALCFSNLFVLLLFVHHTARSSIADQVAKRVGLALMSAISRIAVIQENGSGKASDDEDWPDNFNEDSRQLFFDRSGYVQNIDYLTLCAVAQRENLHIRVHFRAGYYILSGENGLQVGPARYVMPETEREILDCFIIGATRTATQDIEYSVRHLVEIALRALSPGINDSFTAIAVIDRLSAALAHLFEKEMPGHLFHDDKGILRVNAKGISERDIVLSAFAKIRHSGKDVPYVLEHLLKKIQTLLFLAHNDDQRRALYEQILYIEEIIALHYRDTLDGAFLQSIVDEITGEYGGEDGIRL